jgi:hypothetical protein
MMPLALYYCSKCAHPTEDGTVDIKDRLSKLAQVVMLSTCIQEVVSSNLDQVSNYSERVLWFY